MSRAPYVSFAVRPESPGRRLGSRDVVEALSQELSLGRLPVGSRLPPVRVLEAQLGLSKNTVQTAYDELVARGLLETREREGVFVAARSAGHEVTPAFEAPLPKLKPPPDLGPTRIPRDSIMLSTVFVDPELLPRDRIEECARSVLREGLAPFYDAQGHPGLRDAIARRLRSRGMDVDADEVIVTCGSQQALDIVARASEVRRVAVESPTYSHARLLFENAGLNVTSLPFDPFRGIPLDEWEQEIRRARPGLLYNITSFQNPTGYSYSTHELTSLLSLAERYGFSLLEDDWGSDMLSGSEYRPMLRLLGGKNVLYVNSFTKKLWPSLRVGFVVAAPHLVPALIAQKRLSALGNPWLTEATVAEFLERGYYDAHLGSLQRELDARYAACLETLSQLMPEGVRWTTPGGGPTLWLELPRSVDLEKLRERCALRKVLIESTRNHFAGAPNLHGFRVSFAFSPVATLRRGLEILAEEITRA
jgi:DNA-binding transcriptional MocR family regulator